MKWSVYDPVSLYSQLERVALLKESDHQSVATLILIAA